VAAASVPATQLIAIIINPISGGARAGAGSARAELARALVARRRLEADIHLTERPGHARELAQSAATNGADRVIAWGGDGTINEIASVLAFGQVPMGIVPAGSGNGLARELGLPFEAAAALEKAVGGSARAIDVGEIEQRLFVNVAGIGIDAHVAARFNAVGNLRRGPRTYVALTAAALTSYRAKTYDIVTGGERITKTALLIVLANGTEFGNRILIARGARVDDGLLDMVVVEERSRLATISRVPWLLARSIHRVPVWSTRPVIEVTIESAEPILFHVDGEPVQGGRRVTAQVRPGALQIVT
jgi:YegS/Rv2252/BmrU family lipid kinase